MGQFRVEIVAVGGHGCQREVKHGQTLAARCENPERCPDCISREYVEKLRNAGVNVNSARLVHWPDAVDWNGKSIVDDLMSGQRKGEF